MKNSHYYSPKEEFLNAVTHGAGFIIVIIGIAALWSVAAIRGLVPLIATLIYGLSLMAVYAASTAYHAAKSEKPKLLLRKFDHSAIFLLIAGTYTPMMMLAVGGKTGYWILAVEWICAAIGITVKCFTTNKFHGLSLVLYCIMGWMCLICIKTLLAGMSAPGFILLFAGGVFYTLGIIPYAMKRQYSHAIWHFFVLCGSTLQFLAVFSLLL